MKNEKIKELCNLTEGWKTRLKELHWSAPNHSLHTIVDDFSSSLASWQDEIMEDAQAIFGLIEPGEVNPQLPSSIEIENLLVDIRKTLAEFLDYLGDVTMWTGIKSETESFVHEVNKTIYLVKLAK